MRRIRATVVWVAAVLAACSPPAEPPAATALPIATPPAFDFKTRVGVANMHAEKRDACLAMLDPSLAPGTKLTLVDRLSDNALSVYPPGVGEARVVERLTADCSNHLANYDVPSTEIRRGDPSYYRIETADVWKGGPYVFAIVSPASPVTMVDGRPSGDVDGDGTRESFRACTSREGVHLQIWSGEPLTGRPRWHWYVYAGYDTESNCADKDYFGPP